MQKPWSDTAIERAAAWWRDGLTAYEIGERLGVTRNAVIGKMNRLGLVAPPGSQAEGARKGAKARVKKFNYRFEKTPASLKRPGKLPPEPPKPLLMPPARATGAQEALRKLRIHDCRWPIGDPRSDNFRFCGARKYPGSSYCVHHFIASINPYPKGDDDAKD